MRVWDLLSQACVATLKDHFAAPTGVAFSEDGWIMLTVARDEVMLVWNLRDFSRVKTVPVFEALEGIVSVPEQFWPEEDQNQTKKKQGTAVLGRFITGGVRGRIRVWKLTCTRGAGGDSSRTYDCTAVLEGSIGRAQSVVVTEDEKGTKASAGRENASSDASTADSQTTPLSWQVDSFHSLWPSFKGAPSSEDASSNQFICITRDQTLVFFNCQTLEQTRSLIGYNDEILDITYIPDFSLRAQGGPVVALTTNSEQVWRCIVERLLLFLTSTVRLRFDSWMLIPSVLHSYKAIRMWCCLSVPLLMAGSLPQPPKTTQHGNVPILSSTVPFCV